MTPETARTQVQRAIADGHLERPKRCACGSTGRIDAHHDDYERPLDVRWLCRACHVTRHKQLGTGPWAPYRHPHQREMVIRILEDTGDINAAAVAIGVSARTLYRRMAEFGIRSEISYSSLPTHTGDLPGDGSSA